jgi:hypothetical protein
MKFFSMSAIIVAALAAVPVMAAAISSQAGLSTR